MKYEFHIASCNQETFMWPCGNFILIKCLNTITLPVKVLVVNTIGQTDCNYSYIWYNMNIYKVLTLTEGTLDSTHSSYFHLLQVPLLLAIHQLLLSQSHPPTSSSTKYRTKCFMFMFNVLLILCIILVHKGTSWYPSV